MKKRLARKEYTEISEEIRAAVEEVAKKHGFTSSIPSFTFNEGVKGIFNGVLRLMDGDDILFTSKEHTTADTYAKDVVFPGAHILGSKFKGVPGLPALTFTIVDIRKSKLTPFVVVSEEGDKYKVGIELLRRATFITEEGDCVPFTMKTFVSFLQGETFRAAFKFFTYEERSDLNLIREKINRLGNVPLDVIEKVYRFVLRTDMLSAFKVIKRYEKTL